MSAVGRLARVTVARRVAAPASAIVTLGLLLTVACALLVLASSISRGFVRDLEARGSLGQIELTRAIGAAEGKPLTGAAVHEIGAQRGVTAVEPLFQVGLPWGRTVSVLQAQSWQPHRRVPLVAGRAPRAGREIVLPERIAGRSTRGYLDSTIVVDAVVRTGPDRGTTHPKRIPVVGIYGLHPAPPQPDTAYLTTRGVLAFRAAREGKTARELRDVDGADSVLVQAGSADAARTVAQRLQHLGYSARATADAVDDLSGLPGLLVTTAQIAAALVGLAVILGSASRASEASTRRLREFALLRAFGWTRGELRLLLVAESLLLMGGLSLAAAVIGSLVAAPALGPVADAINAERALTIPLPTLAAYCAGLVALSMVGALIGARRALRGDPYLVARSQG